MTKTMLITGASSGIGEASAQYFLKQGWNVVATARSPERISAWSQSPRALVLLLDVTDDQSIASAINEVELRFGAIGMLVNNAGVGLAGLLEAISIADLEQHFQTNSLDWCV